MGVKKRRLGVPRAPRGGVREWCAWDSVAVGTLLTSAGAPQPWRASAAPRVHAESRRTRERRSCGSVHSPGTGSRTHLGVATPRLLQAAFIPSLGLVPLTCCPVTPLSAPFTVTSPPQARTQQERRLSAS